jgi:hypothetical protein
VTCISLTLVMILGNEMHATIANAGLVSISNSSNLTSIQSARWSALAQEDNTLPLAYEPYIKDGIKGSSSPSNTGSLFYLINNGSIALTSVSFTLKTETNKTNSYVINIASCTVTWNQNSGNCGGTATILYTVTIPSNQAVTTNSGTLNIGVPVSSSNTQLRIQYDGGGSPTIKATLDIKISTANIRGPISPDS